MGSRPNRCLLPQAGLLLLLALLLQPSAGRDCTDILRPAGGVQSESRAESPAESIPESLVHPDVIPGQRQGPAPTTLITKSTQPAAALTDEPTEAPTAVIVKSTQPDSELNAEPAPVPTTLIYKSTQPEQEPGAEPAPVPTTLIVKSLQPQAVVEEPASDDTTVIVKATQPGTAPTPTTNIHKSTQPSTEPNADQAPVPTTNIYKGPQPGQDTHAAPEDTTVIVKATQPGTAPALTTLIYKSLQPDTAPDTEQAPVPATNIFKATQPGQDTHAEPAQLPDVAGARSESNVAQATLENLVKSWQPGPGPEPAEQPQPVAPSEGDTVSVRTNVAKATLNNLAKSWQRGYEPTPGEQPATEPASEDTTVIVKTTQPAAAPAREPTLARPATTQIFKSTQPPQDSDTEPAPVPTTSIYKSMQPGSWPDAEPASETIVKAGQPGTAPDADPAANPNTNIYKAKHPTSEPDAPSDDITVIVKTTQPGTAPAPTTNIYKSMQPTTEQDAEPAFVPTTGIYKTMQPGQDTHAESGQLPDVAAVRADSNVAQASLDNLVKSWQPPSGSEPTGQPDTDATSVDTAVTVRTNVAKATLDNLAKSWQPGPGAEPTPAQQPSTEPASDDTTVTVRTNVAEATLNNLARSWQPGSGSEPTEQPQPGAASEGKTVTVRTNVAKATLDNLAKSRQHGSEPTPAEQPSTETASEEDTTVIVKTTQPGAAPAPTPTTTKIYKSSQPDTEPDAEPASVPTTTIYKAMQPGQDTHAEPAQVPDVAGARSESNVAQATLDNLVKSWQHGVDAASAEQPSAEPASDDTTLIVKTTQPGTAPAPTTTNIYKSTQHSAEPDTEPTPAPTTSIYKSMQPGTATDTAPTREVTTVVVKTTQPDTAPSDEDQTTLIVKSADPGTVGQMETNDDQPRLRPPPLAPLASPSPSATPASPSRTIPLAPPRFPSPARLSNTANGTAGNVTSLYSLIASRPGSFSTLKRLIDTASTGVVNFTAVLSNASMPITLLAPTDQAFAAFLARLGPDSANIAANSTIVGSILSLHVLPLQLLTNNITNNMSVPTLFGVNLTTLVTSRTSAALLNKTITFISPGSNATVTQANLTAGRAIMQVIDTVLLPIELPPATPQPSPPQSTMQPPSPSGLASVSLYQVVSAPTGQNIFSTFKALVDAASTGPINFVRILEDRNNAITAFIPTNQAFAALFTRLDTTLSAAVQNLTLATDIIMTHIVADFYPTTALTSGLQLPTLNAGVNVSVLVNATGGIAIQSPGATADVIQGDLLVGNSVGQVINAVLLSRPLPPGPTPSPATPPPSPFPSPIGPATNLFAALQQDGMFTTLLKMIDTVSDAANSNTALTDWRAVLSDGNGAVTLFAPIESAIQALITQAGPVVADSILTNAPFQNKLLSAHIITNQAVSPLTNGLTLTAAGGQSTVITVEADNMTYVSNTFTEARLTVNQPGITAGAAGSVAYPIEGGVLSPASMADLLALILGQ